MKQLVTNSWEWFSARAHTRHAQAWLFVLSFTESCCFIVPPEVLLIPMLMADSARWMWYALFTSFASMLGAVFGYLIAYLFFDALGAKIIAFYHLTEEFQRVAELFAHNAFWVMFTAAFTPIPFKVFVLAAGFFKINFLVFIIASLLGRTLRYTLISYIAHRFGALATRTMLAMSERVTWILTGLGVLVVLSYVLLH